MSRPSYAQMAAQIVVMRDALLRCESHFDTLIRCEHSHRAWSMVEIVEGKPHYVGQCTDPFMYGPEWETEFGEQHPMLELVQSALSYEWPEGNTYYRGDPPKARLYDET